MGEGRGGKGQLLIQVGGEQMHQQFSVGRIADFPGFAANLAAGVPSEVAHAVSLRQSAVSTKWSECITDQLTSTILVIFIRKICPFDWYDQTLKMAPSVLTY